MIEAWPEYLLQELEDVFRRVSNHSPIKLINVYVVGSVVFGREKVGDIDICLHTKKEHTREEEYQFRKAVNEEVGISIDIKFRPDWSYKYQRCDLGFIVPYYDLFNRELKAKAPGDHIPFHFAFAHTNNQIDTNVLVAYDSFKGRRVLDLMKMHEKIVSKYQSFEIAV